MADKPIKHALMRTALSIHRHLYEKCRFRIMRGWWPDLDTPKTVNEYVLSRKLNEVYAVPELSGTLEGYARARELVPELQVPNVLVSVERPDQMEAVWALPDGHYILKGSHGSGMVRCIEFPRDRSASNRAEITAQVGRWLKTQFSRICGETCYDSAKPVILVEELLGNDGRLSADIKIHCHADAPHVVQFIDRHKGYMERLTWVIETDGTLTPSRLYKGEVASLCESVEPLLFRAVSHARTLCRNLGYVRIDFLIDRETLYFGEFTFVPGGGCMPLLDEQADKRFYHLIMREPVRFSSSARAGA